MQRAKARFHFHMAHIKYFTESNYSPTTYIDIYINSRSICPNENDRIKSYLCPISSRCDNVHCPHVIFVAGVSSVERCPGSRGPRVVPLLFPALARCPGLATPSSVTTRHKCVCYAGQTDASMATNICLQLSLDFTNN